MMRISVCVGEYAKIPYCIAGLEIPVYCMEELCYCLRENAFLLDTTLMEDSLVNWIGEECGLTDLAQELYPMVRKQGSLSAFVSLILEYVGLYSHDIIRNVEQVLKEGSGLSGMEKRKNQIDYLVRKGKYPLAVHRYDILLSGWQEDEGQDAKQPGYKVKAGILHNKGVSLTGMMEYMAAADCFLEAYETDRAPEHYRAYLAAKRTGMSEEEYLSFVAEQPDSYEESLELEKEIERMEGEFRDTEAGRKLADLREWRAGGDKQKYYEEVERITCLMKENYRNSGDE